MSNQVKFIEKIAYLENIELSRLISINTLKQKRSYIARTAKDSQ